MDVFKVLTVFTEGGDINTCDGIEWQGKIWLVPHWIDNPATQIRMPVRIVHLGPAGVKVCGFAGHKYMTEVLLLPRAVFLGQKSPTPPIEVIESPPIEIQIPKSGIQ